jgi:hypothetical protein
MKNKRLLMKTRHELLEVRKTLEKLRSEVVWYKDDEELKAKIEKAEKEEFLLNEKIKERC